MILITSIVYYDVEDGMSLISLLIQLVTEFVVQL